MAPPMVEALRRAEGHAELRETHISWVLVGSDRVVKLKKPVDLGFLDFSTVELRKQACEAELHLNRRLAPDVYLEVVPVTRPVSPDGEGPPTYAEAGYQLGGEGPIVDHAVLMKRLPDADRADQRLARGELHDRHLRTAAEVLADFHARAETGPGIAARGEADAVRVSVVENFDQTRTCLSARLDPDEASELERWQLEFLDTRADLFHDRAVRGRVRNGHGDLRLEHLYFDRQDHLRILDCIEFSDRLRHLDVACDVAFLAMDLGVQDRVDLAERFLALYAEAAQDFDLYALVDFYESYRAFVRGKIACIVLEDPSLPTDRREALEADARRYFRLALASERRSLLPPTLIAVGGMVGTGKSTLADHLSRRAGTPVVSSDRTRKALFGVGPTEPLDDDAYSPAATERVYAEVLRRAEVVIRSGRPVVVDASLRAAHDRAALARLAERLEVPLRVVECQASAETARARLSARRRAGPSVSDAGPELYDTFAKRFEPMTELDPETYRAIDTEQGLDVQLEALEGFVPMWPRS